MHCDQEPDAGGVLITDSAYDEAIRFLAQGSLGAARFRFEDVLQRFPDHPQARAFVAWIDFVGARHASELRAGTAAAFDLALREAPDPDLYFRRALLFRLDGRPSEAIQTLEKALRLTPGHALARGELAALLDRRGEAEWPVPLVEDTDVHAAIIVQRRIFNRTSILSFRHNEVRVGCADQDEVVVSDAVFPFVAKRHCTLLARQGHYFVWRTASLGRVWVGGEEIPVRTEVPLPPGAVVTLCHPSGRPPVALRVFGLSHLHDMTWKDLTLG